MDTKDKTPPFEGGAFDNVVFIDAFRNKFITDQKPVQHKYHACTLETAETAWLEAKRKLMEEDSPVNIWAESMLHQAFLITWGQA